MSACSLTSKSSDFVGLDFLRFTSENDMLAPASAASIGSGASVSASIGGTISTPVVVVRFTSENDRLAPASATSIGNGDSVSSPLMIDTLLRAVSIDYYLKRKAAFKSNEPKRSLAVNLMTNAEIPLSI